MTVATLAGLVGKRGAMVTAERLTVEVEVLDARQVFGRVDVLVRPVSGSGQAWVEARRVDL